MSNATLRHTRPFLHRAIRELPTLLHGVEASWNQMQLVQHALALLQNDAGYARFAAEMLAWAWQQRPLDKAVLQGLVSLQEHAPHLTPQTRVLATILNKHLTLPDARAEQPDMAAHLRAAQAEDRLPTALLQLTATPGAGLYWLGEAFSLLLDGGCYNATLELVEKSPALASLPQIAQRLRAAWAMEALPPEEALREVEALEAELFPQWRDAARAGLLQRLQAPGGREEAGRLLAGLWQTFPWHVNACLAAHELLAPPFAPANEEDLSSVCVALYSWNKAEDLARTLESLSASTLGGARVVCLDNGSTDATPQVLERARRVWKEQGNLPCLEVLRLPVNIGAPAARDWLLRLPQAQEAKYLAYLDDDIYLPRDWLRQLVARAEATPRVSAVGCRVERHKKPHLLQAADFNILPPELCASGFTDFKEKVFVFNNGLGSRDTIFFRYSRPCVSVTGCCHLLSVESLRETGGFDIRFSPSQFDDLERDLRAFAAGYTNAYQGALTVRHVQYSSLEQAQDRARQSHIHGNKLKLEHLFQEQDLQRMALRCRHLLEKDFTKKAIFLDEIL